MNMHKQKLLPALVLSVILALFPWSGGGFVASAQTRETQLNWQITDYGIDKLHAQGIDGRGQTIAIFEGNIDLEAPELQGADIEFMPLPNNCQEFGTETGGTARKIKAHGTHVASMIVGQGGRGKVQGVAPRAKLIVVQVYAAFSRSEPECKAAEEAQLQKVMAKNPTIYSSSVSGNVETHSEYLLLTGNSFFNAVGNTGDDSFNRDSTHFSLDPGTILIGAANRDKEVTDFSYKNINVALTAPGEGILLHDPDTGELMRTRGTSLAAPYTAGVMALAKQKWPQASNLQLQQSLAHTTAAANGNAPRNPKSGYGHIDPVTFINTDPSKEPNEPPFLPDETTHEFSTEGDIYIPFYNVFDGIKSCEGLPKCVDGALPVSAAAWVPPGTEERLAYRDKIHASSKTYDIVTKVVPVIAVGFAVLIVLGIILLIVTSNRRKKTTPRGY